MQAIVLVEPLTNDIVVAQMVGVMHVQAADLMPIPLSTNAIAVK